MASEKDMFDPRLREHLDQAWIDCIHFEFECPNTWSGLTTTPDPRVRFCEACKENVHLVFSQEQLIERAKQRQCVAVISPEEVPDPDALPDVAPSMVLVGRVA